MNRLKRWWLRQQVARLRQRATIQQQITRTHRATAVRLAQEAYDMDMMVEPLRWAQLYHESKIFAVSADRHRRIAQQLTERADALEGSL